MESSGYNQEHGTKTACVLIPITLTGFVISGIKLCDFEYSTIKLSTSTTKQG